MKDEMVREIPHLDRFARALTGDVHASDDLVQDTLERSWRKRHLRMQGRPLRPWLFRIMYRLFLTGRRRAALEKDTLGTDAGHLPADALTAAAELANAAGDAPAMRMETREVVAALATLPADQRAPVVLVALEGVSYEAGAEMLGIPPGTFRSRLFRGREALAKTLDAHPQDADEARPRLRTVE